MTPPSTKADAVKRWFNAYSAVARLQEIDQLEADLLYARYPHYGAQPGEIIEYRPHPVRVLIRCAYCGLLVEPEAVVARCLGCGAPR